jgi:hypothetical protein
MEHPAQVDLIEYIAEFDARKAAEALALTASREVIGGNGGPPLEDPEPVEEAPIPSTPAAPTYADLERIGQIVHGTHWAGKIAHDIAVDQRQMRRWQNGEGTPTPRAMGLATDYALRTAKRLLAAVGEDALAGQVQAVIDRKAAGAVDRGRELHIAALAKAREKEAQYLVGKPVVSLTRIKPKAPRRPRAALA